MFYFRLFAFIETAALRSIVLRYTCAPIAIRKCFHTQILNDYLFVSFLFLFGDIAFSEYFCTMVVFSLYGDEMASYVFHLRMVFFYLVTMGWIFDISLSVKIQSIKTPLNLISDSS